MSLDIYAAGLSTLLTPSTQAALDARPAFLADAIDPVTRDYISITRGLDPTDGAVLEALAIERDSGPAVQGFGHPFFRHTHVAENLDRDLQDDAALTLAHLVNAHQIQLRSVSVQRGDDWAELQVRYHNAGRGDDVAQPVPLQMQLVKVTT